MPAYYNEIEPFAAHVLRQLIADGCIAPGDVDTQSVETVQPDDLKGYDQIHLFAGAGLWSVALRLAGVPDDYPIWTGSPPCQPFSIAGEGRGNADSRHLWPHFHRLVAAARPTIVFGEQVGSQAGHDWFDGVAADMEGSNYAIEAFNLPACAVNAPHIRSRLYWVATSLLAHPESIGRWNAPDWNQHAGRERAFRYEQEQGASIAAFSGEARMLGPRDVIFQDDHIARRIKPGIRPLVASVARRVQRECLEGNCIVPTLAAEFVTAYFESRE